MGGKDLSFSEFNGSLMTLEVSCLCLVIGQASLLPRPFDDSGEDLLGEHEGLDEAEEVHEDHQAAQILHPAPFQDLVRRKTKVEKFQQSRFSYINQSWAVVHPSMKLANFLGAQVGALYSNFGWASFFLFKCAPSSEIIFQSPAS